MIRNKKKVQNADARDFVGLVVMLSTSQPVYENLQYVLSNTYFLEQLFLLIGNYRMTTKP